VRKLFIGTTFAAMENHRTDSIPNDSYPVKSDRLLGLKFLPNCDDPATEEPEVVRGSLADIWRDKPVAEIDGHDIYGAVDSARKHGSPGRARRLAAALSTLFSWLLRHRRIAINPAHGVWRPGPPPPRERVLSDAEIAVLWKACDRVGTPFGELFRVLLVSGCRLREAAQMSRNELVDGIWSVPGSRVKNGRSFSLALPQLALQIIEALPPISSEFVFSTNGHAPVSGFSKTKRQLDTAMAEIAGKPVPAWRLHDLRRTAASGMAALGIQLPVIEKVLNHTGGSFGGIVGVYQKHQYAAEKAEALQRWAAHIAGLVSDREAKIVSMRR
jgi:integrase